MALLGASADQTIATSQVRAYLEALLPLAAIALEPSLSSLFSAQTYLRILERRDPDYLDATWEGCDRWSRPQQTWPSFDELSAATMRHLYDAARSASDTVFDVLVRAVEHDARLTEAEVSVLSGPEKVRREVFRWLRSPNRRPLRAFLSYCREDATEVRQLHDRLTAAGVEVWLDEVALLPGHDWKSEIAKAVRRSDVVIVCLSRRAVAKVGYVQKEIREALQYADEHPPDSMFVVPVRFDECAIPPPMKHLHYVDLWTDVGYQKLLDALHEKSLQIDGIAPPTA